ncbi:MAG: ABC transporter permease subunit [Thermomicrobiales bacterium]
MSRLIPTVAIAVPYYLIIQSLDLINSFWALILIYSVLTLPFTILVLTLYFRSIPIEIDEAAQLEGASLRILKDIGIPLALPASLAPGSSPSCFPIASSCSVSSSRRPVRDARCRLCWDRFPRTPMSPGTC